MLRASIMWRLLIIIVMGFPVVFDSVNCIRVRRHNYPFDDAVIHTEFVDRSNMSPIFAKFNLSEDQMKRITEGRQFLKSASDSNTSTENYPILKDYRVNMIKNTLLNAFQGGTFDDSVEYPSHEMAAYPKCNAETTETSWLQYNNVTIQFSHSLFEGRHRYLNLDSAFLRLYKINPNITAGDSGDSVESDSMETSSTKLKRCSNPLPDTQIRVTVSVVQSMKRNKRGAAERKKRIFNSIMMSVSKIGWVEIDIKHAIKIWENVSKQIQNHAQFRSPIMIGWLMIEVHDEEEQPLKPGLFFKPPSCDQADTAYPWNSYRQRMPMFASATIEVPRYPRIDVKVIGYPPFPPMIKYDKDKETIHAEHKRQLLNTAELTSDNNHHSNHNANNHLQETIFSSQMETQPHYQYRRHLKSDEDEIDDDQSLEHKRHHRYTHESFDRPHPHLHRHHYALKHKKENDVENQIHSMNGVAGLTDSHHHHRLDKRYQR